jgi:hypothetical protein
MFKNHFEKADEGVKASNVLTADGRLFRRTAASENAAKEGGRIIRGNEVPVGASPGPQIDEENAFAAESLDEEEKAVLESFRAERAKASKGQSALAQSRAAQNAQSAKSQTPEDEEPESEGEGEEAEDVTDQFPKAAEVGCIVNKTGKTYTVYNAQEEVVGETTTKKEVEKILKDQPAVESGE